MKRQKGQESDKNRPAYQLVFPFSAVLFYQCQPSDQLTLNGLPGCQFMAIDTPPESCRDKMADVLLWDDFESYASNDSIPLSEHWDILTLEGLSTDRNSTPNGMRAIKQNLDGGGLFGHFSPLSHMNGMALKISCWFYDSFDAETILYPPACGLSCAAWSGGAWHSGGFQNQIDFGPITSATHTYDIKVVFNGPLARGSVERSQGWRFMELLIESGKVTGYVDGVRSAEAAYVPPEAGWNTLRLGAFASTPGAVFYYDDVRVRKVNTTRVVL